MIKPIDMKLSLRGGKAVARVLTYAEPLRNLLAILFAADDIGDLRFIGIDPRVVPEEEPIETIILRGTALGDPLGIRIRFSLQGVLAAHDNRDDHGDGKDALYLVGQPHATIATLVDAGYRLHNFMSAYDDHVKLILGHAVVGRERPDGIHLEFDTGSRTDYYPSS